MPTWLLAYIRGGGMCLHYLHVSACMLHFYFGIEAADASRHDKAEGPEPPIAEECHTRHALRPVSRAQGNRATHQLSQTQTQATTGLAPAVYRQSPNHAPL